MAKFKQQLGIFLKTFNQDGNKSVAPSAKSSAWVTPGDVFSFTFDPVKHQYPPPESFRVVLVVEAYGGQGIARTSRGTPVLCGFILTTLPAPVIAVVLKALHGNQVACSYSRIIKHLSYIFGKTNFRTFGLAKISNFYSIDVDKSKLDTETSLNYNSDDYDY